MAKKQASTKLAEYCGNCRFYLAQTEGGQCRRFPAQVIVDGYAVFSIRPIMEPTEWCGEHQLGGKQ